MEPILFVKLTAAGCKDDTYVNLTKVTKMYHKNLPGYGTCTAISSCDNSVLYVKETPEEIMRKTREVMAYDDDL